MEEKKLVKPHSVKIENRAGGTLTGVKKLISAAPNSNATTRPKAC